MKVAIVTGRAAGIGAAWRAGSTPTVGRSSSETSTPTRSRSRGGARTRCGAGAPRRARPRRLARRGRRSPRRPATWQRSSTARPAPTSAICSRSRRRSGTTCSRRTCVVRSSASRPSARSCARRGDGRIVNIASDSAFRGRGVTGAHYATSKAGLLALTRRAAAALAPAGVTVNAVAPGTIDGETVRELAGDRVDELAAEIPAGRLGRPEEIAALVAWLLSRRGLLRQRRHAARRRRGRPLAALGAAVTGSPDLDIRRRQPVSLCDGHTKPTAGLTESTLTSPVRKPTRMSFERAHNATSRADQTTVRRANLGVVLQQIAAGEPRSRARVAADTGLTRGTVSSLVGELIELDLLRETSDDGRSGSRGPPRADARVGRSRRGDRARGQRRLSRGLRRGSDGGGPLRAARAHRQPALVARARC